MPATQSIRNAVESNVPAGRDVAALTLDEAGVIVACDGNVEAAFAYSPGDLISRHVSTLLPRLGSVELMRNGQLNARLRFLCHVGVYFQVRRGDLAPCACLLSLTDLGNSASRRLRLYVAYG